MHRRTLTIGTVLAVLVGLLIGTTTQSGAARPRPTLAADSRAAAVAAADRAMTGPHAPTMSPGERYLRQSVLAWIGDIYSISYGRTYRGLPVVGADAAVLADGSGRVHAVQKAGDVRVDVPTRPTVGWPAAERTARTRLRVVDRVDTHRLVVRVDARAAQLAWEAVLVGRTDNAPSRLHVYVDASTGAVLDSVDEVHAGVGHSAWNGPDPITIDTQHSGSTYSLRDPLRMNLSCVKYGAGGVISKPVDDWGNGNPTNIETGCVDAMWAAQKQFDMLRNWVGRNGQNGNGGTWPLQVGLNDVQIYWDGTKIVIGHNTNNQWLTSMDLVGHEYGHGIDRMSPGWPFTERGLTEGFADIMGTLTEAYANEPAPFDTPDYLIGETVDLTGSGPLRFMYDPALRGDANCYSSAIPTMDEYRAAGVFNHWFYLLAEGSHPGGGKPDSPTCIPTPVTGVGIRMAAKVVYQGLLFRAGGTNYRQERRQTLYAAKALDPTCDVFRKTKAAWDAVAVPASAADPTCT
ncbi:M4 family metallopeptidase [Embleya scabrispora]|uniref:M4 family metallopeptidase n=1 Tax=Embleya scabrispora TaxID=159449 RepID=UPI00035DBCBF|nr:M4 family metallopeptidase [Embleya scabrispora]MYS85031.1 M4 family peptidase [Streptomyces sp. SID5474]